MGRGRQKAKQTRVARELKYHTSSMDVTALQRELSTGGFVLPPQPVVEIEDDEDDPYAEYAAYADDEDDEDDQPGYASQRR